LVPPKITVILDHSLDEMVDRDGIVEIEILLDEIYSLRMHTPICLNRLLLIEMTPAEKH